MRIRSQPILVLILLLGWCAAALVGCDDEEQAAALRTEILDIMEEAGVMTPEERAANEERLEDVEILSDELVAIAQQRAEKQSIRVRLRKTRSPPGGSSRMIWRRSLPMQRKTGWPKKHPTRNAGPIF